MLLIAIPVTLVLALIVGIAAFGSSRPSSNNPETKTIVEPFTATAAGDTSVYLVALRFPNGIPSQVGEATLDVSTGRKPSGRQPLRVSITPQVPPGISHVYTGVGDTSGISNRVTRAARYSELGACAGCEQRYQVVVTAGGAIQIDLHFSGLPGGRVPAGLGPVDVTVLEKHRIEGSPSRTLSLDLSKAVGKSADVWFVWVSGPAAAFAGSSARLVTDRTINVDTDVNSNGSSGPSVSRADRPSPAAGTSAPADAKQTIASGLNGTLPLDVAGCATECRVGLWVLSSDFDGLKLELRGQGEALKTELAEVESKTLEQTLPLNKGERVARTLTVTADGDARSSEAFAIVPARFVWAGEGGAGGHLGDARLFLRPASKQVLALGPCAGAGCDTEIPLDLSGTAPGSVKLTVEAFFVAPDGSAPAGAMELALR